LSCRRLEDNLVRLTVGASGRTHLAAQALKNGADDTDTLLDARCAKEASDWGVGVKPATPALLAWEPTGLLNRVFEAFPIQPDHGSQADLRTG
jgi:hypothetical protein